MINETTKFYVADGKFPGYMTDLPNGATAAKMTFMLREARVVESYSIMTYGYYGPGSSCQEYDVKEVAREEYDRLVIERAEYMAKWLSGDKS